MKYWWLTKYLSFLESLDEKVLKSKKEKQELQNFLNDCRFSLPLSLNHDKKYKKVEQIPLTERNDYELVLSLTQILYLGKLDSSYLKHKLLDKTIYQIVSAMQKIPASYLPSTDYTLTDMLTEIVNLKDIDTSISKIQNNNLGACYTCEQIFYTDMIHQQSKSGACLCPYCNNTTLYFDNDYLPMDINFLYLAFLYHQSEIPFLDLVSLFQERVILTTYQNQDAYTIQDGEEIGSVNLTTKEITLPLASFFNTPSGKEEDYLRITLLRLFETTSKTETNLHLDLSSIVNSKNNEILSVTIITTFLIYFLRHYFSPFEKVTIILDATSKEIFNRTLEELLNFTKDQMTIQV